jgi:hypothetical protein
LAQQRDEVFDGTVRMADRADEFRRHMHLSR